MALTGSAASGINRQNIANLRKMFERTANAVPDAVKKGGMVTAMTIKPRWYSIAAANGMREGGKIARRKWRISDSVRGKSKGTASLIIGFDGPVHLVFAPTKQHFIGAKLLGTKNSLKAKSRRIGTTAAFGGSNRGAFGQIQRYVNYSRYGSTRHQAALGELRLRAGAQALTIPTGSSTLRAYAFHPGTAGKDAAWPAMKAEAVRIGPDKFGSEINKALAANFGKGVMSAASAATGGTL